MVVSSFLFEYVIYELFEISAVNLFVEFHFFLSICL